MIKINLVPGEILAKARQRQLLLQAGLVVGVLGVGLALISLWHWAGLRSLQKDYIVKESKLKTLQAIVDQVKDLEKQSKAVHARLDVIVNLLKGRAFYPLFMSEFVRTVPGGVKVTTLSTASSADGVLKLAITAVAERSDDVANWMRALGKNGRFTEVKLGPVSASGRQFSFSLSTVYTLKL